MLRVSSKSRGSTEKLLPLATCEQPGRSCQPYNDRDLNRCPVSGELNEHHAAEREIDEAGCSELAASSSRWPLISALSACRRPISNADSSASPTKRLTSLSASWNMVELPQWSCRYIPRMATAVSFRQCAAFSGSFVEVSRTPPTLFLDGYVVEPHAHGPLACSSRT